MEYKLEKKIWTTPDFEQMGWHDSKIYAIAFDEEKFTFIMDIDYILQWVNPMGERTNYQFWVSPATLLFENVWDVIIDIQGGLDLQIGNIYRENPRPPKNVNHIDYTIEYDWRIELIQGEISFKSVGYKQYIRREPVLLNSQQIGLVSRKGASFSVEN